MKSELIELCIQFIKNEWLKLEQDSTPNLQEEYPWAVWIRLYEPIPLSQNILIEPTDRILRTWFLTKHSVEERGIEEYGRFVLIKGWESHTSPSNSQNLVTSTGRFHHIGLAAFAQIIEVEKVYLEVQWGKLYGQGYLITVGQDNALHVAKSVWRS